MSVFKGVETCKWFQGQFSFSLITQAIMTPYKSYPWALFKSFELCRRLDFYAGSNWRFQCSRHVLPVELQRSSTLHCGLWVWVEFHSLVNTSTLRNKTARQISLKWVVLQIKAEEFKTTHLKNIWVMEKAPVHPCEQVGVAKWICSNLFMCFRLQG